MSQKTRKKNYSHTPPPGTRQAGDCRRRLEKILPSFQFYIITKRPLAATTSSIFAQNVSERVFLAKQNAQLKQKSLSGADSWHKEYVACCRSLFFLSASNKPARHLNASPPAVCREMIVIVELNPHTCAWFPSAAAPSVAVYPSERVIMLLNKWSLDVSFAPSVCVCFTRSAVAFLRARSSSPPRIVM